MKKVVLLLALGGFFMMTSCKKEYSCDCTVNATGITAETSVKITDTKKNAEEECESAKAELENEYGSGTASCTLN